MRIIYILTVLIGFLSIACNRDNTTYDTNAISGIRIDTVILQREYNRDLNQTLIIDPAITQDHDLPLSYEWEIDYKVFSKEQKLVFPCDKLGSYVIRLKVSNTDGSAFYKTTLYINSPYEEGITMLSENAAGEGILSFMRKRSAEDIAAGKTEQFENNCLQINNPGHVFPKNPTDVVKRLNQIFISYTNPASIYAINTKTFEVENSVSAPEYPTFIPIKMNVSDDNSRSSMVICRDGSIHEFGTLEQIVLPAIRYRTDYPKNVFMYATVNGTYNYIWTDTIITSYMAEYSITETKKETFANQKFINSFMAVNKDYFITISRDTTTGKYIKTSIGMYIWQMNYDDYPIIIKTYDLKEQKELSGDINLTSETLIAPNSLYKQLLYAVGNNVYRWYYADGSFPTTPWATINLPGAEITSLSLSPDEKQLYVGVHQPGEAGMNGHLYILDADKGTQIGSPYKNIGCKPIKIFYKTK